MTKVIISVIFFVILLGIVFYVFWKDYEKKLASNFDKAKNNLGDDTPNTSLEFFKKGLFDIEISNKDIKLLKQEIHKKIIGMEEFINAIIINVFCGGHLLVEGVPGLAKTKTISSFADVLSLDFKRIQFTPDMLPSDVIGIEIFNSNSKEFEVKFGPIVANIVLADEINRTTPKVQSALLEAMQEKQVTIGGNTHKLPDPFFVLATQNPIEQEGTYPLPEAQVDRFLFKVIVDYPNLEEEEKIIDSIENEKNIELKKVMNLRKFLSIRDSLSDIKISDEIKNYITRLVQKTREPNINILYGASPRASISMMLAAKALAFIEGRGFVKIEDIQRTYLLTLRHRIILSYDAKIEGIKEDDVLLNIASQVVIF